MATLAVEPERERKERAVARPGLRSALLNWRERSLLRGSTALRRLGTLHDQAFGIITYHQVSYDCCADPAMLNVPPQLFEEQLGGLLRLGYEPWSLCRVSDYLDAREPIPREVFVVVLDDGCESVYDHAWPVLKKWKIPATVFLTTQWFDAEPFAFHDNRSSSPPSRSPRPLTSSQLAEMLASRVVDVGSRTHVHRDRSQQEVRCDLEESLDLLRCKWSIERPPIAFSYRNQTSANVEIARELGFRCGLTVDRGVVLSHHDRMSWPRLDATRYDTPCSLAAKLDGWYSFLVELWRRPKGSTASGPTECKQLSWSQ